MKPNTLPDGFDQMESDLQVLNADRRLNIQELRRRIFEQIPADPDDPPAGELSKAELARILAEVEDTDRGWRRLAKDNRKGTLRLKIGSALGIDLGDDPHRSTVRKLEVIRIWLALSGRGNGEDSQAHAGGMVSSA